MDLVPTPSQTVGPFFQIELTTNEHCVKCIAGPQAKGERVWITFRVLDRDGAPVDDVMLEIWQADANGKCNHTDDLQPKSLDEGCIGFGRIGTGEDGTCVLETIKPGRVGYHRLQAPHPLVAVYARACLSNSILVSTLLGTANGDDPVMALVSTNRRDTLMPRPDSARPGHLALRCAASGGPGNSLL